MPFDGHNKWKSGQIRKKFLNKQTHPGRARKNRNNNSAKKAWSCCGYYNRRNARVANKIYLNQRCRKFTNLNCDYYQDTFNDNFFVGSDDEYSSYYGCDNVYENCLYYDDWKATNQRKIDSIENTETDTPDSEDLHYMIEHTKYVNKINNSNNTSKRAVNKPRSVLTVLTDIEISIVAGKYDEYDFVKDKLYDGMNGGNLWTNVPIKLINTMPQKISITINTKQKQNPTHLYLEAPMDSINFFVPIYLTGFSSIYKHHSIPNLLQNNYLLKIMKDYLFLRKDEYNKFKSVFNSHLSTANFDLEQILFEYIPSLDILKNVLCPFIGYSNGVQFSTNIQNIQLLETQEITDKIEIINEKYKSSLHYILYRKKVKQSKSDDSAGDDSESDAIGSEVADSEGPICKLFSDSEGESDTAPVPFFLKYINGYTDDDSDDSDDVPVSVDGGHNVYHMDREVAASNNNVLFKQPYRFCRNSNLSDDDEERDKKWWKDVKYKQKKKMKYKIEDRVLVKYNKNGNWKRGVITGINKKGVTVTYDNPIQRKTKWYNSWKLKWQCRTKTNASKFVYKRNFGSHIKLIQKRNAHSK